MRILHVNASFQGGALPTLEKEYSRLECFEKFALTATAQHLKDVEGVGEFLKSCGKIVVSKSQILGCQRGGALTVKDEVDCYLHLGSGRFHPTILAVEAGKPVYILNPISKVLDQVTGDEIREFKKRQTVQVKRSAGAQRFGIMVSTKPGQKNLNQALKLKEKLEDAGRKAYILVGNELSPQNLLGVNVDALVNTACPRIAEDEFEKPVLNPPELEIFFKQVEKV
ncbi:MAG TPA: hypothetical protein ENN13_03105 [Candidatus Altiarchaeales archaeon]|nr:hypothetical protein [Candidatus Altiarchaeales archaeon]